MNEIVKKSGKQRKNLDGFTPMQELFCQEYIKDWNGTQAALRAGYSPDSATEIASENLTKPHIKARIENILEDRTAVAGLTVDRILRELMRIAFGDIRDTVEFGPKGVSLRDSKKLTADQAAVISEVKESVTEGGGSQSLKYYSKEKALELLGKYKRLFGEQIEVTGAGGGPIKTEDVTLTGDALKAEMVRRGLPVDLLEK